MTYTVGDVIAERTVHLTRESLVRYAGASGDFNPIHYRDDVAASVGLPGVLAHGMLTMDSPRRWSSPPSATQRRSPSMACGSPAPSSSTPKTVLDVSVLAKVGAVDEASARIDLTVKAADTTVLVKAQLRVGL